MEGRERRAWVHVLSTMWLPRYWVLGGLIQTKPRRARLRNHLNPVNGANPIIATFGLTCLHAPQKYEDPKTGHLWVPYANFFACVRTYVRGDVGPNVFSKHPVSLNMATDTAEVSDVFILKLTPSKKIEHVLFGVNPRLGENMVFLGPVSGSRFIENHDLFRPEGNSGFSVSLTWFNSWIGYPGNGPHEQPQG